jgi:catechol 2,3-dioxygenase-like lactoylglutathione lyase family enzyme
MTHITRRSAIAAGATAFASSVYSPVFGATPSRSVAGPGLHHVGLFVSDVTRSIKFYTEALGFRVTYRWQGAVGKQPTKTFKFSLPGVFLDAGDGNYIEFFPVGDMPLSQPGFPLNHFSLRVADVDAVYKRALAAGAKPHEFKLPDGTWDCTPTDVEMTGEPPVQIRIAFLRGLDGELIELFNNQNF